MADIVIQLLRQNLFVIRRDILLGSRVPAKVGSGRAQ